MKVRFKEDYMDYKAGQEIRVKKHPSNGKVYIYESRNQGSTSYPVYIPKIICECVEAGESKPAPAQRTPVFDNVKVPASPTTVSPEEMAVLEALKSNRGLVRPDDDGPMGNASFSVDEGLTIEEKAEALKEARAKAGRDKLDYQGEPKLKEGQFWLTDLTRGKLPDSGVNYAITCHLMTRWEYDKGWDQKLNPNYPWFGSMAPADIPAIDQFYEWDANVLEAVVASYKLNSKCLLVGPPGTGKTSAVKQYAAWTDHPYMRFNGKDGIEQSSFLGQLWIPKPGVMEWQDGLLPQGLKRSYIVCLDEVFKIPPGIQMAMQSLYEKDGFLMLDDKPGELFDKMVFPGEHFRMLLTDNVKGTGDASEMFAATQMQDTSTLDRFDITQEVNYLPMQQEVKMLTRKFGEKHRESIRKLVQFAGMVRDGYGSGKIALTLSPRGLSSAMEMVELLGLPVRTALNYAFINKISDDSERQAIAQFVKTVW